MHLTRASLAKYMDHTLLKPEATAADIDRVVAEARQYGTASVCVNPYWVTRVAAGLAGSGVKTCTVIGFPLGATSTASKVAETRDATAHGAQEIDMVINIGELKAGNDDAVRSDEEKRRACELSVAGGADFVKTSTGFSTGGATTADITLMRETVGPELGVKASGGIRTLEAAEAMIEAGATRLGVSAAVSILEEVNE